MSIEVGTEITPFVVDEVSTEKMKTMALLLRDPNPIHWNAEAVKAAGLGDRVINQGPTNKAFVINAILTWLGDPARLRSITVRFRGNVLGGERVEAGGVVTAIREQDGERLADCDVWLRNGDGADVIVGTATVVA